MAKVEHTSTYVTNVETITDAFAFVMEYMEKVGPHPFITIKPREVMSIQTLLSEGGDAWVFEYEVTVMGMVPDEEVEEDE